MPGPLLTERRRLRDATLLTLILAIPISLGSAHIASAAAPTFQGTFTSAGMCSPRGVGISPSGDVYVGSDCQSPFMAHFTGAGSLVGTWTFPFRYLGSPNGVTVDGSSNVFVTDYDGAKILKYTSSGALLTSWGSLSAPVDVAVDISGNVYVVELSGKRVQKFTTNGTPLAMIDSAGTGPGHFQEPAGIALDAGGRIYVADPGRMRILRFLADGSFDMEFPAPGASAYDMAEGPDGNIYVIRFDVSQVYQYSPGGVLLQTFSSPAGLNGAFRIAIGPSGLMYIAEQYNNRVSVFQIDQATPATHLSFGQLKAMYR